MVVLIKKLANFPHKSKPKVDPTESIALQSLKSNLSESLHRLFSDPRYGSNSLSLSWFIPCFNFIQGMNRAFAKLIKDLDYPVSKWKGDLAEDYLSYTLNILDALNSISSAISHLGISRLSVSHALSLISGSPSTAIHHLKPILPRKIEGGNCKNSRVLGRFDGGKEGVVHEAVVKIRASGLLVLRVLLCGLCGGIGDLGMLEVGELEGFELGFGENFVIKEIEEVNVAVKVVEACLVSGKKRSEGGEAEELKRKVKEFGDLLEMVGKEVNCLFSEVLARRNELIDCLRLSKCK